MNLEGTQFNLGQGNQLLLDLASLPLNDDDLRAEWHKTHEGP